MPEIIGAKARSDSRENAVDPRVPGAFNESNRGAKQRELLFNSVNPLRPQSGSILPSVDPVSSPPLSPEARAQLLEHLSPSAREAFLHREKLNDIAIRIGLREAILLAEAGLTTAQLDTVLENERLTLTPQTEFIRNKLVLQTLLELKEPEFAGLEKIDSKQLVATMASMSRKELGDLPPRLVERISERFQNDPNSILDMQQGQFIQEKLVGVRNIQSGSTKLFQETSEKFEAASLPAFASVRSSGLQSERDGWRERAQHASAVIYEAESILQDSQAHRRVANILQKLLPAVEGGEAEKLSKAVADNYTMSSLGLFNKEPREFDVTAGAAKIREAGEHFANSAGRWDTTVKSMVVIRNGAVVIVAGGVASIAAPVVFGAAMAATGSAAVSTVGTALVGGAIGSATGATLGGVSSFGENLLHVAAGNKTSEEARADFLRQTKEDAYQGGIAGIGGGTGGAVRTFLTSVKGALPLTAGKQILVGSGSAAAGRAAGFTTDAGVRVVQAREEFDKLVVDRAMSPERREQAYNQFMKERGLDAATLALQGVKEVGVASFFGATGSRFDQLRQAQVANSATVMSQARLEAVELSLNTAVGFSKSFLEAPADGRTFSNLIPLALGEVANNAASSMMGRAARESKVSPHAGTAVKHTLEDAPPVNAAASSRPPEGAAAPQREEVPSQPPPVAYHEDVTALRRAFVTDAVAGFTAEHGRQPTAQDIEAIRGYSEGVTAYYNKASGEVNAVKVDRFAPHDERTLQGSDIRHEIVHQEGGGELAAHEAQLQYIAKNGYDPVLENGAITLKLRDPKTAAVLPTRAEVEEYLSKHHAPPAEMPASLTASHRSGKPNQYETGEITIENRTGNLRVGGNKEAVYVSDPELLAAMYVSSRAPELIKENSQLTGAQAQEMARQESKDIGAFYDAERGQVVLLQAQGNARIDRVSLAAKARHEIAHREGKGEFDAWREEEKAYNKAGYQLSLDSGELTLRPIDPASEPNKLSDDDLLAYLDKKYPTSSAKLPMSKEVGEPPRTDDQVIADIYLKGGNEEVYDQVTGLIERMSPKKLDTFSSALTKNQLEGFEKVAASREADATEMKKSIRVIYESSESEQLIGKIVDKIGECRDGKEGLELAKSLAKASESLKGRLSDPSKVNEAMGHIIENQKLANAVRNPKVLKELVGDTVKTMELPPARDFLEKKVPEEIRSKVEGLLKKRFPNPASEECGDARALINSVFREEKNRALFDAAIKLDETTGSKVSVTNQYVEGLDKLAELIGNPAHVSRVKNFAEGDGLKEEGFADLLADPQALEQRILFQGTKWTEVAPSIPGEIVSLLGDAPSIPSTPATSELIRLDADGYIAKSGYVGITRKFQGVDLSSVGLSDSMKVGIRWHSKTPNSNVHSPDPTLVIEAEDPATGAKYTYQPVIHGSGHSGQWIPKDRYKELVDISHQNHQGRLLVEDMSDADKANKIKEAEEIVAASHIRALPQ